MTFRMTLANDDTKTAIANLVAENVLAFIDHIDVMGNNGSLVLERIAFGEHDPDSYARIRCALQGGLLVLPLVFLHLVELLYTSLCFVLSSFKMN